MPVDVRLWQGYVLRTPFTSMLTVWHMMHECFFFFFSFQKMQTKAFRSFTLSIPMYSHLTTQWVHFSKKKNMDKYLPNVAYSHLTKKRSRIKQQGQLTFKCVLKRSLAHAHSHFDCVHMKYDGFIMVYDAIEFDALAVNAGGQSVTKEK